MVLRLGGNGHAGDYALLARLEITFGSSPPLPEPLPAKIAGDDREYTTRIEQGHAWGDRVAISDLENAQLRVEVEAGSSLRAFQDFDHRRRRVFASANACEANLHKSPQYFTAHFRNRTMANIDLVA